MKRVERIGAPKILTDNQEIWITNFIGEVIRNRGYKGMSKTIRDKYNNQDIKEALKIMYKEKCCYCENRIGIEDYENIEHLKPKSLPNFHMLAFSWDNLHWSCGKCNKLKKAKWDYHYPILNPTIDKPEYHLTINIVSGEIEHKSRRGKTTINHTQLNRDELVKARKRIINKLNDIFFMIQSTPSLRDDENLKSLLNQFVEEDAEFSTLIKTYVNDMSMV